jgi:hypothetical protein
MVEMTIVGGQIRDLAGRFIDFEILLDRRTPPRH